jgi:hypothetical protein
MNEFLKNSIVLLARYDKLSSDAEQLKLRSAIPSLACPGLVEWVEESLVKSFDFA